MRFLESLFRSTELLSTVLLAASWLAPPASALLTFPEATPSNLDIQQLGRLAVVGDFNAASLYHYTQQSQNGLNSNGSHSLISRFPNGAFATLQSSDAHIQAMCAFQQGGKLTGVIIGGNFTSLGGVESPGIAMFNPDTSRIQEIRGLSGRVDALYCDNTNATVYVGGMFSAGNSTNAISWSPAGFKTLPFTGFNGAVTSITKSSVGKIVFGGAFDGLGNTTTPRVRDGQQIPLTSASITAGPSTLQAGLSEPKNIICKDPSTDGPGNIWLLADNSPGAITASFGFGFNPTMLRLRNTNYQGRGTKTFRFTAIPINGIMNLTYFDQTGRQQYCDAQCPLPQGNTESIDFHFVNTVGMNGFRLDISEWYGPGGGLQNVQLFQDDIYTFAINQFNEPACNGVTNPSKAETTGAWTTTPTRNSSTDYLTASITGPVKPDDTKVSFLPDLRQSGNYSVTIFTPGCLQDNTCSSRGRVTVKGFLATSSSATSPSFETEIYQTNNYDKYDQIFLGHVDSTSASFKPSIIVAPSEGQTGPLTVVAQRVRFELVSSSGGLNGLFEFDPTIGAIDMNFKKSTVDSAANSLDGGALVSTLVSQNGLLYVGGKFHSGDASNFFSVGGNATIPAGHGLNGPVSALYPSGDNLYVGGAFNGTFESNGPRGLSGIALYNTAANNWTALGAGVRGSVSYIVPFQINLSASKNTDLALAISGKFDQIFGFGNAPALTVSNFAIWIPSKNNWLQNLNLPTIALKGIVTAYADLPDKNPPMFAGSVASFEISTSGSVQVTDVDKLGLQALPGRIQIPILSPSRVQKRADSSSSNATGVLTGTYYNQNGKNLTVLGGHFSVTASNGSTINNLAIIDGSDLDKISGVTTGVNADSTVVAVGISGNSLFAGGSISGNINAATTQGMFVYDISTSDFAKTQPPALQGPNVRVNAIAPQPTGSLVFVGGSFDSAGSLPCPALCVFDTSRNQWITPANNIGGSVVALSWVDETHLLVAGDLTVNGTKTSVSLYDATSKFFTAATSADGPTGTITAMTPGSSNGTSAWVAGTGTNGASYLTKYDGSKWTSVSGYGPGSIIRGIQIFTLTKPHETTPLLDRNNGLLVFGNIVLPSFGNVSAALFNGTSFSPFLLTGADSGSGSIAGIFVANPLNFFKAGHRGLAVGFIVLVGLAISLALIFLIVAAGMLAEILRRRRMGYVQAPSPNVSQDNLRRIPPSELLGGLTAGRAAGRGWSAAAPAGAAAPGPVSSQASITREN